MNQTEMFTDEGMFKRFVEFNLVADLLPRSVTLYRKRRPNKTHRCLEYNFVFLWVLNAVTFLSCVLTFWI